LTETAWIHYARPRPHWYQASEEERSSLLRRWGEIASEAREDGARALGRFHVRGQHDFETVEIWTFPSAQRVFDYWVRLTAAGYGEWIGFSNTIGLSGETTP
jgi:hypothetical protein